MEEQKEFTEEELLDGRPVDPPAESEVVKPEDLEVVSEDGEAQENEEESHAPPLALLERPVMTLLPEHLIRFGYVVEVPFGGKKQTIITVDGIRHIAQCMGISITECEIRESEDGNWFYADAQAVDPHTGTTWHGKVRQSTKYKNGKDDPHAYEKAVTRAQRNAMKGLIPYQRLVNACKSVR